MDSHCHIQEVALCIVHSLGNLGLEDLVVPKSDLQIVARDQLAINNNSEFFSIQLPTTYILRSIPISF